MDIEQLTKHQIVLLTLLVSFVTSIATGIVTVSLMDQAPTGVTKVVNQIVEHTIEKVVPSTQGAAVVTTEKTVVVKDDDLAAQSIAKVRGSIIRIVAEGKQDLIARGVVLNAQGMALTDRKALENATAEHFEAILPSGDRVPLTIRIGATTTPFATIDLVLGTTSAIVPATLADTKKLALGQTVIRIGGVGTDTVGSGVVAALPSPAAGNVTLVEASVSSATLGSVLITLFGEVIGLVTADSIEEGSYFYTVPPHADKAPALETTTEPNS